MTGSGPEGNRSGERFLAVIAFEYGTIDIAAIPANELRKPIVMASRVEGSRFLVRRVGTTLRQSKRAMAQSAGLCCLNTRNTSVGMVREAWFRYVALLKETNLLL